ncbi:hypothetical protein KY284_020790 [Solanum tuberosum]|nr:hypothetical protein KY284_020790 [Solanum tuberosum]
MFLDRSLDPPRMRTESRSDRGWGGARGGGDGEELGAGEVVGSIVWAAMGDGVASAESSLREKVGE